MTMGQYQYKGKKRINNEQQTLCFEIFVKSTHKSFEQGNRINHYLFEYQTVQNLTSFTSFKFLPLNNAWRTCLCVEVTSSNATAQNGEDPQCAHLKPRVWRAQCKRTQFLSTTNAFIYIIFWFTNKINNLTLTYLKKLQVTRQHSGL